MAGGEERPSFELLQLGQIAHKAGRGLKNRPAPSVGSCRVLPVGQAGHAEKRPRFIDHHGRRISAGVLTISVDGPSLKMWRAASQEDCVSLEMLAACFGVVDHQDGPRCLRVSAAVPGRSISVRSSSS